MDRIVLHTPRAKNGRIISNEGTCARRKNILLAATAAFLIAALASLRTINGASSYLPWNRNATAAEIIILCIALSSGACAIVLGRSPGPRRFAGAALEITPVGVQLVSTYEAGDGTASPARSERRVRAFLPRRQIIDVVVAEVVWPHCVWSQVAFRVLANGAGAGAAGRSTPRDGRGRSARAQGGGRHRGTARMKPPSVHELIRTNRVRIIPAFPDECRGALSYEQCLHVQAEIEELLG